MNSCACAARAAASTSSSVASGTPKRDVLADRRREEERILRDDADLAAQRPASSTSRTSTPSTSTRPVGRVVEARHERGERRLARAGVADQRDRPPGRELEVDVLAAPAGPGRSRTRRPRSATRPAPGGSSPRVRAVGDLLGLVDDLEDPLARRGRALRLADPHAEHPQRHDEHRERRLKAKNAAERRARRATTIRPADEQHGRLREQRQEREQRHVERALPVRVDASARRRRSERVVELRLLAAPPARTT